MAEVTLVAEMAENFPPHPPHVVFILYVRFLGFSVFRKGYRTLTEGALEYEHEEYVTFLFSFELL